MMAKSTVISDFPPPFTGEGDRVAVEGGFGRAVAPSAFAALRHLPRKRGRKKSEQFAALAAEV